MKERICILSIKTLKLAAALSSLKIKQQGECYQQLIFAATRIIISRSGFPGRASPGAWFWGDHWARLTSLDRHSQNWNYLQQPKPPTRLPRPTYPPVRSRCLSTGTHALPDAPPMGHCRPPSATAWPSDQRSSDRFRPTNARWERKTSGQRFCQGLAAEHPRGKWCTKGAAGRRKARLSWPLQRSAAILTLLRHEEKPSLRYQRPAYPNTHARPSDFPSPAILSAFLPTL